MCRKGIEIEVKKLPENLKMEVLDYMEFLLNKYEKKFKGKKFNFDWVGGLSKLRSKFSSVELQHKDIEWR